MIKDGLNFIMKETANSKIITEVTSLLLKGQLNILRFFLNEHKISASSMLMSEVVFNACSQHTNDLEYDRCFQYLIESFK